MITTYNGQSIKDMKILKYIVKFKGHNLFEVKKHKYRHRCPLGINVYIKFAILKNL